MAAVYRRGQTYWIRFQWQGKEVRKSARTSSKAVAQQFLARVLEEHRRLDRGGRPRRSYKEAVERFCAEYLPTLKPATQSRYRTSLKQLMPFFGGLHLDEVNKSRLGEYVTARRRAGVTGSTIRRDLAALSSVFTFAVAIDMIEVHPIKAFSRRHIRESVPRTTYPTDAEIEELVRHAPPMMGRAIRFLAETGMRMEEAISLEWSQVSLHRREVRLTKTKTSSPRVVPLGQAAYETLAQTPRHPTSNFVFWHGNGDRYRRFSGHFRRLARKIGFKHRAHDLRHRFASTFLQATGNIAALQAVLGHKTIEMTMRYSHLMTEHLHAAVEKAGTKLGTRTTNPTNMLSGATIPMEFHGSIGHVWTATATVKNAWNSSIMGCTDDKASGTPPESVINR